VNDILDFSRIEARKLKLDRTPFQLRTSLNDLVKALSIRAREHNLSLALHVDDGVPNELIGDPIRLRQVLLNLIDNAIKFTAVGSIFVSVVAEEVAGDRASLRFSVIDTGIGIPEDKQRTIFEAFSQADTSSTRRYGGTGLGLTISSQLVALMGGLLSVESQLGAGSSFQFNARFHLERDLEENTGQTAGISRTF
jgi:signal transduction histidine kinase